MLFNALEVLVRVRSRFFTQTGLTHKVALLAGPLILQNISYTLLGVTDTFFVSRVSTEAVAAVGLAGVLFFALMLLFRSAANSSVVFVAVHTALAVMSVWVRLSGTFSTWSLC